MAGLQASQNILPIPPQAGRRESPEPRAPRGTAQSRVTLIPRLAQRPQGEAGVKIRPTALAAALAGALLWELPSMEGSLLV